jgi:acetyltransferase-like isoleucine patch superfamily enzyme
MPAQPPLGQVWSLGGPLAEEHRVRLRTLGVPAEVLDALGLRAVGGGPLPQWWEANGNALYARPGFPIPVELFETMVFYPVSGALVVLGTDISSVASLLLGGDDATVFIGPDSFLSAAELYCGAGSSIVLVGGAVATSRAVLDARNGGSIFAEQDQLWAANAYIATDDMHRLEDLETGERLNPYGARIHLGRHVWLCRDAVVSGHAEIGEGCVVGLRSLVRGQKVPPNTAVAGTPARVIREGITWRGEDTP